MPHFLSLATGIAFGLVAVYPIHAAAIMVIVSYYTWSK